MRSLRCDLTVPHAPHFGVRFTPDERGGQQETVICHGRPDTPPERADGAHDPAKSRTEGKEAHE